MSAHLLSCMSAHLLSYLSAHMLSPSVKLSVCQSFCNLSTQCLCLWGVCVCVCVLVCVLWVQKNTHMHPNKSIPPPPSTPLRLRKKTCLTHHMTAENPPVTHYCIPAGHNNTPTVCWRVNTRLNFNHGSYMGVSCGDRNFSSLTLQARAPIETFAAKPFRCLHL